MKRLLRRLPIEVYVLFLPTIIFLISIFVFVFAFAHGNSASLFHGSFVTLFLQSTLRSPVIVPILLYILICMTVIYFNKRSDRSGLIRSYSSFVFVMGIFVCFSVTMSLATQLMFNTADHSRVIAASAGLAFVDKAIFHSYPWLYLNQHITSNFLEAVIVQSYLILDLIGCILVFITACYKTHLFRKLILSLFIAFIIGIPFWVTIPALSPDDAFRSNILGAKIPDDIKTQMVATHFSAPTLDSLIKTEAYWVDKTGKSLGITSFPSMHAAWGIIITVIGIEVWAPFAIVLIPWLLLELVGTVFTLQHYAVDTIFGILVGFLALFIVKKLFELEERYFKDEYDIFFALKYIQGQVKYIFNLVRGAR